MFFFVRYPAENSVPQRCTDKLQMAVEQPEVGYWMLELLQHLGRATVAFTVGGNEVERVDVVEIGTGKLNAIAGVPLVDYLVYLLPRHCRRELGHDIPDATP